jgi:hypothetical protein
MPANYGKARGVARNDFVEAQKPGHPQMTPGIAGHKPAAGIGTSCEKADRLGAFPLATGGSV